MAWSDDASVITECDRERYNIWHGLMMHLWSLNAIGSDIRVRVTATVGPGPRVRVRTRVGVRTRVTLERPSQTLSYSTAAPGTKYRVTESQGRGGVRVTKLQLFYQDEAAMSS